MLCFAVKSAPVVVWQDVLEKLKLMKVVSLVTVKRGVYLLLHKLQDVSGGSICNRGVASQFIKLET